MEFTEIRRIGYLGNKQTNKYKNNVQLYVQPYFTDKDTVSLIDLKDKKYTSNMKIANKEFSYNNISKSSMGKYTYYRFLSSQLSKHTGQYCLMMNISKAARYEITKKSTGGLDKYLMISDDEKKEPLLLIILNAKTRELLYYE